MDPKIVLVSMTALENILRFGQDKETGGNLYADMVEETMGLDKLEFLQSHENLEIYRKAFDIIEK